MRSRTFVGFGFGAIQGGLFLYEACQSGNFERMVVAEVLSEVVQAARQAGNWFCVNVARSDRVEQARVGPVQMEDPASPGDRERLVETVAEAEEIATAVPSVRHYVTPGPGSIHRLLAEGLRRKVQRGGPPVVVYAAENHNQAAEILEAAVLGEIPGGERPAVAAGVRFLNTVIGKMSRVVTDPGEIRSADLARVTPQDPRAFLVESFNHILISRVRFAGTPFRRGITVFEEKDDLLPFEEAKLFGHNATHALAAYLCAQRGIERLAALRQHPGLLRFLRTAFLQESGETLIRKHAGVDRLFTPEGYCEYADDLLERMANPYLFDTVERVGRDPERKLGWEDRLVGLMRTALEAGVRPARFAFGAAAALAALAPDVLDGRLSLEKETGRLWIPAAPDPAERRAILALIGEGLEKLRQWRAQGFPDPEGFFAAES